MKRSVLMWLTAIAGMLLAAPAFAQGAARGAASWRGELGGVDFRFRHGDCLGRLRLRARKSGVGGLRRFGEESGARAGIQFALILALVLIESMALYTFAIIFIKVI